VQCSLTRPASSWPIAHPVQGSTCKILPSQLFDSKRVRQAISSKQDAAGCLPALPSLNLGKEIMKTCSRCNTSKSTDDFENRKRSKDGKDTQCKACRKLLRADPTRASKANARTRAWASADPERALQCASQSYKKNRTARLHGRRKYLYGLEPEHFEQMKQAQNNKCGICPATEPGGRGNWHVDHNHETGAVRSLLCADCNTGLGKFKDSPALLIAAAQYVQHHHPIGDSQ
jgi:hypothetical protein